MLHFQELPLFYLFLNVVPPLYCVWILYRFLLYCVWVHCLWVLVFVGFCLIDFKSVDVSHIPTDIMYPPQHSVTEKCFGWSSGLIVCQKVFKVSSVVHSVINEALKLVPC